MNTITQPLLNRTCRKFLLFALCLAPLKLLAAVTLEAVPPPGKPLALGHYYEYLEDNTSQLTIGQLLSEKKEYTWRELNKGDSPNLGYSNDSYWFRVQLQALAQEDDLLLELPFPTLDKVDLFIVRHNTSTVLQRYHSGDKIPFSERPFAHRNLVFPLTLPPNTKVDLYLHITSAGSLTVGSYLWSEDDYYWNSRKAYSGYSIYFGALLALFFYHLLLYHSLRDKTYLHYLALLSSMALAQAAWFGIGYEYLWPTLPAWANVAPPAGFCAAGLFGALFSREFLKLKMHSKWLDNLVLICAILFGLVIATIPLVPYPLTAIATSLFGIIFSLTVIASGIVCLRRGNISARYFLLAWAVLLVGIVALAMRNLGWLPTNTFTNNAMLVGSAIEMLLLSLALAERIHVIRRAKEEAENAAIAAHHSMLDVLEKTEQELETRVRERTSDLEALNQRLQSRERQLETLAHHDPLTGLRNRLGFENHMKEALIRAGLRQQDLGLMMLDLDGFKTINDQYGHDVGDALLKVVGRRLLKGVRSTDTVARLGGDEFVILLENIHSTEELQKIAEGIVHSFDETVALGQVKLSIGISIGIAKYPRNGRDQPSLIKSADQAMYHAKVEGRGRYKLAQGL